MKKTLNIVAALVLIMFAGTALAQHGRGHLSSGHSRSGYTHVSNTRSFGSERNMHTYSRSNVYSRDYHSRSVDYGRSVAYGRGGYAGRRVIVPWGRAHGYAYGRPVYFPAYRLYYDPVRCGYTYWYGGRWLFSAALPAFLAGVDLAAAQMAYATSMPQPYYAPAPGVGIDIHIGL